MSENSPFKVCPQCSRAFLMGPVKKPEGVFKEGIYRRACSGCGTIFEIEEGGFAPNPQGPKITPVGILPEFAVRLAAERMIAE